MKKNDLLCVMAVVLCLTAALLFSMLLKPKQAAPQTLLSESQQEDLLRFPKSLYDATEEDLLMMDGIGREKAAEILAYVQTYEIHSMEQLLEIEGIGTDTLETLKKYFYLF